MICLRNRLEKIQGYAIIMSQSLKFPYTFFLSGRENE